jgi:small subunit ribosomal protein S3
MEAGALGVEVIISGKLRTERARYEKFRAGYLPKSGQPAIKYMRKAELHVQLKPGIFGVKVRIMPPDAEFPDKVQIIEPAQVLKEEEAKPPEAEPEEPEEAEETKEVKESKEAKETEK